MSGAREDQSPDWLLNGLRPKDQEINTWNSERLVDEYGLGRIAFRCDFLGALTFGSTLATSKTVLLMWSMYGLSMGMVLLSFTRHWWFIALVPPVLLVSFLTTRKRTASDVVHAALHDEVTMKALRRAGVIWAEWK